MVRMVRMVRVTRSSRMNRRQYRGNRNRAHLHDVAARALRAQIFVNVRHVRPLSLGQRTPVYRSCQGLIGAVPIGITW